MSKWLALLEAELKHPRKTTGPKVPEVTKALPLPPSGTNGTSDQGVTPTDDVMPAPYRLVNQWEELTPVEQAVVSWLACRGLVTRFQVAAGLGLTLAEVNPILATLDEQRFLVAWGKQIGLNVYAKRLLSPAITPVCTSRP